METQTTKQKNIIGIDQSIYNTEGYISELTNFRFNEISGYSNDIGWEPLLTINLADQTVPTVALAAYLLENYSACRFLRIWSKHDGAEQYYLYERNGKLQYDYGNAGSGAQNIVLDSNRTDPKADDPGTQLISCGKFCILLNGNNAPIKFYGREKIEPFSWSLPPGRLSIMPPQPSAIDSAGGKYLDPYNSALKMPDGLGLGSSANGSINSYSWRMSFLSDTGSESPLSEPVSCKWEITTSTQEGSFAVPLDNISIGPEGTVARIIYRTKNIKDGLTAGLGIYYEAFRINENVTSMAIDTIPDSLLKATPVDLFGSSAISHNFKYGAVWDNRIWLAGGSSTSGTIIYSETGKYEQFPLFNYLEASSSGGAITGIVSYYNSLLIFKEQSIDIVTKNQNVYQISNLDPFVGTTATNTIKFVPNVGICFLTIEGVYAISGGLQGGSAYKAVNISDPLNEEWNRLTKSSLARATAIYSKKEMEYWVHYPADGARENVRGAVYHLQSKGWSLRNTDTSTRGEMRFSQLDADPIGQIVMGTVPTYSATAANCSSWPGLGLQVWSRNPACGKKIRYDHSRNGWAIFAVTEEDHITSTIVSKWEDLGSLDIKKTVNYVMLDCLSQGNNLIPLVFSVDNNWKSFTTASLAMQQAEYYNTTSSQNILPTTGVDKPVSTWNSTVWERTKRISVRYDTGSTKCNTFSFRIQSPNSLHILGYRLGYTVDGTKGINQRG